MTRIEKVLYCQKKCSNYSQEIVGVEDSGLGTIEITKCRRKKLKEFLKGDSDVCNFLSEK